MDRTPKPTQLDLSYLSRIGYFGLIARAIGKLGFAFSGMVKPWVLVFLVLGHEEACYSGLVGLLKL